MNFATFEKLKMSVRVEVGVRGYFFHEGLALSRNTTRRNLNKLINIKALILIKVYGYIKAIYGLIAWAGVLLTYLCNAVKIVAAKPQPEILKSSKIDFEKFWGQRCGLTTLCTISQLSCLKRGWTDKHPSMWILIRWTKRKSVYTSEDIDQMDKEKKCIHR